MIWDQCLSHIYDGGQVCIDSDIEFEQIFSLLGTPITNAEWKIKRCCKMIFSINTINSAVSMENEWNEKGSNYHLFNWERRWISLCFGDICLVVWLLVWLIDCTLDVCGHNYYWCCCDWCEMGEEIFSFPSWTIFFTHRWVMLFTDLFLCAFHLPFHIDALAIHHDCVWMYLVAWFVVYAWRFCVLFWYWTQ